MLGFWTKSKVTVPEPFPDWMLSWDSVARQGDLQPMQLYDVSSGALWWRGPELLLFYWGCPSLQRTAFRQESRQIGGYIMCWPRFAIMVDNGESLGNIGELWSIIQGNGKFIFPSHLLRGLSTFSFRDVGRPSGRSVPAGSTWVPGSALLRFRVLGTLLSLRGDLGELLGISRGLHFFWRRLHIRLSCRACRFLKWFLQTSCPNKCSQVC